MTLDWLRIERRDAPLIVSIPHAGTDLAGQEARFVSPWLARRDADWHIPALYDFCAVARGDGGADRHFALDRRRESQSRRRLALSRAGDDGALPDDDLRRRAALSRRRGAGRGGGQQSARRAGTRPITRRCEARSSACGEAHARVALYDAHSIRSVIPRLFDGELPVFNLGTNSGRSCSEGLRERLAATLAASGQSVAVDGRFKGGWITRDFGSPGTGVEAVQLELACRAYLIEPARPEPGAWPAPIDDARAAPTRATLRALLGVLLEWTSQQKLKAR